MSTIIITTPVCVMCGESSQIEVESEAFYSWRSGTLTQIAFPEMPADQREQLISGTHSKCWDEMWSFTEDEEESE